MSRDISPYFSKEMRHSGADGSDGKDYYSYMNVNPRQRPSTSSQSDTHSPLNRNYDHRAQTSDYDRNSSGTYVPDMRPNITGHNNSGNKYSSDPSQRSSSIGARTSFGNNNQRKSLTNYNSTPESPDRHQSRTFSPRNTGPSTLSASPPSRNPLQRTRSEEEKMLRFSPPPGAASRQLSTHSVPTKLLYPSNQSSTRPTQSPVGGYGSPMLPLGGQHSFYNRGPALQPPLPSKPPSPPPPPPKEAPPPDPDAIHRNNFVRYHQGMPYLAADTPPMIPAFPNPPPAMMQLRPPPPASNFFLNPGPPRMMGPPRTNLYNPLPSYNLGGYGYLGQRSNNYKRKQSDVDMEMRKNNKKRKKPLSQNIPQRKDWSVEEAQRALEVEQECNKRARRQSLIIKFPDLELNRDIVSRFHSAIENVHFQQPSTARFCFVTLRGCADPETVINELNRTKFGAGYLCAEVKKDREDDLAIGPEDIDPTTLYVGNLAQDVTKEAMMRTFPNNKRIDIGYAKKMKYTRYAFVSFMTVDLAIEAFKKTHNTQMHSKSLIVRFRRLHGTVGMPGEPKLPAIRSDSSTRSVATPESEAEPQNAPWDMVDVSSWIPDVAVKNEPSEYTDDEYEYYDDYQEKMDDQYYDQDRQTDTSSYYDDSSEDLKPSLPILPQDPAESISNNTINGDERKTDLVVEKKETDETTAAKSTSNAEGSKDSVKEKPVSNTTAEKVDEASPNNTTDKIAKEIATTPTNVKKVSSITESPKLAPNRRNVALHRPLIELVKKEVSDQETNVENDMESSKDKERIQINKTNVFPKPATEEKPKIDFGTGPSSSQTTCVKTVTTVPKPIVQDEKDKPKIELEVDTIISSAFTNKFNKESLKTDQLLEQISDAINTLSEKKDKCDNDKNLTSTRSYPRPFIILPEVKQEPPGQSQDIDSKKANTLSLPRPIMLPKMEKEEDLEETSVSNTLVTSLDVKITDEYPKPLIKVKKESPKKEGPEEKFATGSSSSPLKVEQDENKSNGNSGVSLSPNVKLTKKFPMPLTEVKKDDITKTEESEEKVSLDDSTPARQDQNKSNSHSSVSNMVMKSHKVEITKKFPMPLTEVKKDDIMETEESEEKVSLDDSNPARQDQNKSNSHSSVSNMVMKSHNVELTKKFPMPLTEVKKDDLTKTEESEEKVSLDDSTPASQDQNKSNGHSSVSNIVTKSHNVDLSKRDNSTKNEDVKEEKPDFKYAITDEFVIKDSNKKLILDKSVSQGTSRK